MRTSANLHLQINITLLLPQQYTWQCLSHKDKINILLALFSPIWICGHSLAMSMSLISSPQMTLRLKINTGIKHFWQFDSLQAIWLLTIFCTRARLEVAWARPLLLCTLLALPTVHFRTLGVYSRTLFEMQTDKTFSLNLYFNRKISLKAPCCAKFMLPMFSSNICPYSVYKLTRNE